MMNWETYRQLSPRLKDEYNFRFKDTPGLPNILYPTIVMFFLIILFMFTAYISVQQPELHIEKANITNLINACINIAFVTSWWIVVILVEYLIKIVYYMYAYRKWKKENNIIEIYWWNRYF